jgi:hypothetical protein
VIGKKKLYHNKNNKMERTRLEIEWSSVELKATYKVKENWAEYEGHGKHFIDEGERVLSTLELYFGGETIDITNKIPSISKYLKL